MPSSIPTRGAASTAQELRDFISQQAAGKSKDKQARFDTESTEVYRKSSGTTWNWGRNDSSKKARHAKIESLKTQMLEKFGPSYADAIKSAFARQKTVALKDGTRVYRTGPTFAQLQRAIEKGDRQSVVDEISTLQQGVNDYSKFLSTTQRNVLNSRIEAASEALEAGDLDRAHLDINGENDLAMDQLRPTSRDIMAITESKAKKAAARSYRKLKTQSRKLFKDVQVPPQTKQSIKAQLSKARNYIHTGDYAKAIATMRANVPGTSMNLRDHMQDLKANGTPKNFPQGWHSRSVQSKVAQMNKKLVFGGDDGDCFYGAISLQLGIPMQQVRQDVHQQAKVALRNNAGNDLIFNEIPYNELKTDVRLGLIKEQGNGGDFRFAQLVADKYERPVTMIDPEGNTRTYQPLNNSGQPAIVMAYNGGHFDAVIDKQPSVQPQNNPLPPHGNPGNQPFNGLTPQQVQQING